MEYQKITPKGNYPEKKKKINENKSISTVFKNVQTSTEYIEIPDENFEFIKIVFRTQEEIGSKNSDIYDIMADKMKEYKEIILIFDFQILSIELDTEELYNLIKKFHDNIYFENSKLSIIIKNSYINPDNPITKISFDDKLVLNKLEIHDELYSLSANLQKFFDKIEVNELILKKFKFNSKSQLSDFCSFIVNSNCKKLTLEDIYIDLIIKKHENDVEYKDLDIYFAYIEGLITLNNSYTPITSLTLRDCPLFAIIGNMFTHENEKKNIDIDETSLINPSIITKFKIKDGYYDIWFDLDSYKIQLEENEDFNDDYDFVDYLDYIFNIIISFTRDEQKIKIHPDDDGIGKIDREYFHKLVFKNFDVTKFEFITGDDITFIEEKNWVLNEEEKKRKAKWEKLEEDLDKFHYNILYNVKELVFDNCSNFFIKWILNFTKGKVHEIKSYNYDLDLLKLKKCGKDYVEISKILCMKINKVIFFDTPLIIGNKFPKNNSHLDSLSGKLGTIDNLVIKLNSLDTYGREHNLKTYKTYEILIELIKKNNFNKNITFELNALSNIMTLLAYIKYLGKQNFYNDPNEEEDGIDYIDKDQVQGVIKEKDLMINDEQFLPQNIFFSSKKRRDYLYYQCFNLKTFDENSKITLKNLTIKKSIENFDNQNYLITKNKISTLVFTSNNQLKKINFGSDGFYIDRDYKYFFSLNNIGTVELINVVCSNFKDNIVKDCKDAEQETIINLLSDNEYEKESIKNNKYEKTKFPNYIIDVKTLNGILYKNNAYEDVGMLFRFFMYKVGPQNKDPDKISIIPKEDFPTKKALSNFFMTFKKIFETFNNNIKKLTVTINTIKELKEFYCTTCILRVLLKTKWIIEKVCLDEKNKIYEEVKLPQKVEIEKEIGPYFLKEKNEEEIKVYAEMNYYYTSYEESLMIRNKEIKIDNYTYHIQLNVNFEKDI